MRPSVLLIDHEDSFTWNLCRLFESAGAVVTVKAYGPDRIPKTQPHSHLILGPGPGTPDHYPRTRRLIESMTGQLPILGICLGMQALNEAAGGRTQRAPKPVHGRAVPILHRGGQLLSDLPSPFPAARYHSLMTVPDPSWSVTAQTIDGLPMALENPEKRLYGLQFHPESFLTEHGLKIAENFLYTTG